MWGALTHNGSPRLQEPVIQPLSYPAIPIMFTIFRVILFWSAMTKLFFAELRISYLISGRHKAPHRKYCQTKMDFCQHTHH